MIRLKQDKKGMTLVELMVASVLGAVLIGIAVIAIGMTFQIYGRATALSEGGTLRSTLYHAIADELRYATLTGELTEEAQQIVYQSSLHGGQLVTMKLDEEGYLSLNEEPALGKTVYAGYRITELTFSPGEEGCILVSFTLRNVIYGIQGEKTEIVIRCLN